MHVSYPPPVEEELDPLGLLNFLKKYWHIFEVGTSLKSQDDGNPDCDQYDDFMGSKCFLWNWVPNMDWIMQNFTFT